MKRWLLAVGLVVFASFTASAAGITIKTAQYILGYAVVQGTATPGADIYWEGAKVAKASSTGGFLFISVMPWDCVGTLSDGPNKIAVVVKTSIPLSQCRPAAPVPQTGQHTSYTPGDDGDIQSGVVLPTPRFTDNGDGTLRDNLTNLIWLKNGNCATAPATSQQNAIAAILQLNTNGKMNGFDCGDAALHKDWRLPNIAELQSLINYGFVNPAFSNAAGTANGTASDPFSNFQVAAGYWSSTTYAGDPTIGWGINFSNPSTIINNGWKTFSGFVLAVRGGTIF
jgi:hypothetical protein